MIAVTLNRRGATCLARTIEQRCAMKSVLHAPAARGKNIQELASLPSRNELLAKVLFLIQAPAQRLVTAMNGVGRNLAVVVDQAVKENKFSG